MEHVDVVTKKNKHKTKKTECNLQCDQFEEKNTHSTLKLKNTSANTNTKQIKRHIKRKTKAEKIRQSVCFLVK